jgi:DNA-binding response OmpR family regulator
MKQVLIFEEDPDLASIFTEAFTAAGSQVELVKDESAAHQALAKGDFAILVFDFHRGKGVGLLQSLRASERFRDAKILVLISFVMSADDYRAYAEVLIKPVGYRQMLALAKASLSLDGE